LLFGIEPVQRQRVAAGSRRDDERAVAIESYGNDLLPVRPKVVDLFPWRGLRRTPVNAAASLLFLGDRRPYRALAIDDPAYDITWLAERAQRFPARVGVQPVYVGIAFMSVVGDHENVVGAVMKCREELRIAIDPLAGTRRRPHQ